MTGRGAWTKIGMPSNGTGFYQLLSPIEVGSQPEVDFSHRAVWHGVKNLQQRINKIGYTPKLVVDGHFGATTNAAALWAQKKLGVVVDGQVGPRTCAALFWPAIYSIAAKSHPDLPILGQYIGGIAMHESGFDTGAVGFSTPDDWGVVQINGPANPTMTEDQRFDYHTAFQYAVDRIAAAYATYHNWDYAIASYASPLWAQQWAKTGIAPNPDVVKYVDYVKAWRPPILP